MMDKLLTEAQVTMDQAKNRLMILRNNRETINQAIYEAEVQLGSAELVLATIARHKAGENGNGS